MRLNRLYILLLIFCFAIAQTDTPEDSPENGEKKKRSFFKIFQRKDKVEKETSADEVQAEDQEEEKKGLFNRKKKKAKFEKSSGIFQRFRKKSEDGEETPSDEDIVRIPFTPISVDETVKSASGDREQESISDGQDESIEDTQSNTTNSATSSSAPSQSTEDSSTDNTVATEQETQEQTQSSEKITKLIGGRPFLRDKPIEEPAAEAVMNTSNAPLETNQVLVSAPSASSELTPQLEDEFEDQLLETIKMQNEKIDLILNQLGFSDEQIDNINTQIQKEPNKYIDDDTKDMLDLLQIVQNKFFEIENTVSGSDSLFFDVKFDIKNIQKKIELMNLRLETKIQSLEFNLSMIENEFDDRVTQLEIDSVTKDAEIQELRSINEDVVLRMLKLDDMINTRMMKLEGKMTELDDGFNELKKLNKDLVLNVVGNTSGGSRFESSEGEAAPPLRISKSEYKKRYDEAYLKYLDGNYSQSMVLFNELLALENINDLTDNCQYWLGEIHYSLKNYNQAINSFNNVFAYKNNNKGVYAQYKLGLSYLRIKDTSNAVDAFRKVIQNYPNQTDLVKKSKGFIEKYK